MAQKNRTKEIWLIPKRGSLHQTICLIDGIIERNYDRTSWNPQKQNNLGVNLKKWGATENGKNISQQGIRTLVAALPQYLGFLYIDTKKTPSTICLTDAGIALWNTHKNSLVKIPNLKKGKELLITESPLLLKQMEKLQITNPVILKNCKNIYLFPFRFMLKLLLKVNYLDREEIAYFLFKARNEDEIELVAQEILNFRKLPIENREDIIKKFKSTHIGNITLVSAPSSGYFMSLCEATGIVDKTRIKPQNRKYAISALKIKDSCIDYVNNLLEIKYNDISTFDFEDNLQLWIDYIGTLSRDFPPINIPIKNKSNTKYLIQIFSNEECKYDDLINEKETLTFPLFVNEQYSIKLINTFDGTETASYHFTPTFDNCEFKITQNTPSKTNTNESLACIKQDILEHCETKTFAGNTLNYLKTLSKLTGIDKTTESALRGAYFEYLVFKILNILKNNNVIDEVIWNGHLGKYGLPISAPGGKTGTADIVFTIDDLHIVMELTTIKAKSTQFSAEGSSVPDHIRLYKNETKQENVIGVFCAPIIHDRNTAAMRSNIAQHSIPLHCITTQVLVDILESNNREKLKNFFNTQL